MTFTTYDKSQYCNTFSNADQVNEFSAGCVLIFTNLALLQLSDKYFTNSQNCRNA